MKKHPAKSH